MIIDHVKESETYLTLNPLFDKAFDYVRMCDIKSLPAGRYEIDGDRIFMNIVEHKPLRKKEDAKLEVHDKYIDIQVVLDGSETFGWSSRKVCEKRLSDSGQASPTMDNVKDIMFYPGQADIYFTLNPGQCVVFFPNDAHAPLIGEGEVKKCIIKVLASI